MSLKLDPSRVQDNNLNISTSGASNSTAPNLLFNSQQQQAVSDNAAQQSVLTQQKVAETQANLLSEQNKLLQQKNDEAAQLANAQTNQPASIQNGTSHAVLDKNNYQITTSYGGKSALSGRPHYAIDIGVPMNTPIYNPSNSQGKVVGINPNNGEIKVRYDNGYSLFLAHLNKTNFKIGDVVAPGAVLGLSGNRGYSTGPHLHLQILDPNGKPYNPTNFYYGKENPFAISTTGKGETMNNLSLDKNQNPGDKAFQAVSIPANGTLPQISFQRAMALMTRAGLPVAGQPNPNVVYPFPNQDVMASLSVPTTVPNLQPVQAPSQLLFPQSAPINGFVADPNNPGNVIPGSTYADAYGKPQATTNNGQNISPTTMASDPQLEALDKMYQGQIDSINTNNQLLFHNAYDGVGVPKVGDFGSNPIDQQLVDLNIVDQNSGKALDADTLNALRAMVGERTRAYDLLGKESAQSAAGAVNTAQQSKRAFVGRNPGDTSASFAGRNALGSFDRAAQDNINANNLLFDKQKLAVDNSVVDNSIKTISGAKQQQLAIDLQKAGLQFQAAAADNSANAQKNTLQAAKDYNILIGKTNLKNQDQQSKLQIAGVYSTMIQALTGSYAAETDATKKADIATQIAEAQKKQAELLQTILSSGN